jgi:tetratricopeptide (TPR) repeat protein
VKIHPSDLLLEEMLLCMGGGRSALRQHLASCPACRFRLSSLGSGSPRQAPPLTSLPFPATTARPLQAAQLVPAPHVAPSADYGSLIERSERTYLERLRDVERERAEAVALVDELSVQRAESRRRLLLANSSRFQTWGVYERLLHRSWEVRDSSAQESEDLARMALEVSDHLDTAYYTRELIEDLRSRAWSYIANLRRRASDLEGAEKAFQTAYAHLKLGTREPFERAVYLDLRASLLRAQRRFTEAATLLTRAITIFRQQGNHHRAVKCVVNLSILHERAGQTAQAIAVLQEAMPQVEAAGDERSRMVATHHLIHCHVLLGRFIEAQGLYRTARPLYRKYELSGFGNHRLWIKGMIEHGLGQDASAEALFLKARQGFLHKDVAYEAALVSMELAGLYANQHRHAELKQLAAEMVAIFAARNIGREALAAASFFQQATAAERISGEIVKVVATVAAFLKRAQGDSTARFEAPAQPHRQ